MKIRVKWARGRRWWELWDWKPWSPGATFGPVDEKPTLLMWFFGPIDVIVYRGEADTEES